MRTTETIFPVASTKIMEDIKTLRIDYNNNFWLLYNKGKTYYPQIYTTKEVRQVVIIVQKIHQF